MFDTAEDEMSSSSSGSVAEGTSNTEMISKEMRFFEVPNKEETYSMENSKSSLNINGSFPELDRPLPYSPPRDGIIVPHKHYHCRMCDQEFENKSDMQRHAKDVHRMDEKSHKCQKCLKSFPSSQQLAQHLLVHTNVRKYSCKFCDKMFKQLSHVQQHLRIHTGERPYKCTVDTCLKSFRQLSSLQQHIKGHNIPLPKSYPISKLPSHHYTNQITARPHDLICQVCERQCENDSMFFEHLQQQHPDYWKVLSGEHQNARCKGDVVEVFVCPTCSQEFSQIGELKRHQILHHPDDEINDSNFNICVCQKIFNNDSQFIKHLQSKSDFQHQERYKEMVKKIHSSNIRQYGGTSNGNGVGGNGIGGDGVGNAGCGGGVFGKHLEDGKRKFEDGYNKIKIEDTQDAKFFKRDGNGLGEDFKKDRGDMMMEDYKRERNEMMEEYKRDVKDLREDFKRGNNGVGENYRRHVNIDSSENFKRDGSEMREDFKSRDNGLSDNYQRAADLGLGDNYKRDGEVGLGRGNDTKTEFKRDGNGLGDNYNRDANIDLNLKRDGNTELNFKRDEMGGDMKKSPYGSSASSLSSENPAENLKRELLHANN